MHHVCVVEYASNADGGINSTAKVDSIGIFERKNGPVSIEHELLEFNDEEMKRKKGKGNCYRV